MTVNFGTAVQPKQEAVFDSLPAKQKRLRPRFHLMVNKNNWSWDKEEKCYLPDLSKLVLSGGVGGVALSSGGIEDDSQARANYMKKGFIIVENGDQRLLELCPNGRYLVSYPVNPYGKAYGEYWMGYEKVGRKIIWEINKPEKVKFQKAMVEKGFIPNMHIQLRKMNLTDEKKRLRALENKSFNYPNNSHLGVKVSEAKKLVKALEADLKKAETEGK